MSGMRKSPFRPLEAHEDRPRALSEAGQDSKRKSSRRSGRQTRPRRFGRRVAVKEFFGQRESAGVCAVDAGCEVERRFQQQQQRRQEEQQRLKVQEQEEELSAGQSEDVVQRREIGQEVENVENLKC